MGVNLKSMLLGIGLILVLFIVLGQTDKLSETAQRYQIIISSERLGNPLFLLDTVTGTTRGLEIEPIFYWGSPLPTIEQALRDSTFRSILQHYYEEKSKGQK